MAKKDDHKGSFGANIIAADSRPAVVVPDNPKAKKPKGKYDNHVDFNDERFQTVMIAVDFRHGVTVDNVSKFLYK